MKNIFKKNQIIIVALAVMLIIAGYLNFSEKTGKDKTNTADNGEVLDYDATEQTKGDNILDGDMVDLLGEVSSDLLDPTAEGKETDVAEGKDSTEVVTEGETEISDKDAEEVATYEVTDTGEVVSNNGKEENTEAGEAIFVSTTISPNYFAKNRLEREQIRAKNKEDYLNIINNANLSEEVKAKAVDMMLAATKIAEQEDIVESLLEAKGFEDAYVRISENGKVDVVINAVTITEQDAAKIEDVVKSKTGAASKDISIAPVVAED